MKEELWKQYGACRDLPTEVFFHEVSAYNSETRKDPNKPAKKICREDCQVREQCLKYAMDNKELFGIWGGLDERQRRLMRRRKLWAEAKNVTKSQE